MVFKTNGLLSHAIFSNCDVIKLYLPRNQNKFLYDAPHVSIYYDYHASYRVVSNLRELTFETAAREARFRSITSGICPNLFRVGVTPPLR